MLPWLLCAALAAAVLILCVRLLLLHRAMDELRAQLPELLGEDTNVLLGISSRDKHARALAAALNRELRELRRSAPGAPPPAAGGPRAARGRDEHLARPAHAADGHLRLP